MPPPTRRHQRENHPLYPSFVLGGTHIRDLPPRVDGVVDQILVSLPWSYNEEPAKTYPVVYLCDGFWDFSLVWAMYSHLLTDKAVPEYILVGLGYGGNMPDFEVLRLIDLHSISRRSEARNHTPDYLARLKNIIFPFVEREYAVDTTFQVLGGCSSGAAFAIAAMFAEPELFQAIIALSPLFDLRFAWLSKLEEEYFQKRRNSVSPLVSRASLPVRLFLGVGGEDSPQVKMEALRFNEHLDNRCYRGFQKELRWIDGERHCAVKPEGFNRGLRYVFAPFV